MSELKRKRKCQVDDCNRPASTLCFCCNKSVCTRHFNEHIDAIKTQIDPLVNEVNTMVEQIQHLTIEQITERSFDELHEWKDDMNQLIQEIFLAKTKEMENLIENNKNKFVEHKNQQWKAIVQIKDQVRQLAQDGDATLDQIQSLKKQLTNVETNLAFFRENFLSVNVRLLAQGLVTVSSNLEKTSPTLNQVIHPLPIQNLSELVLFAHFQIKQMIF